MKLVGDAVRAVTLEVCGVLVVVWMLIGCASWGFEGSSAKPCRLKNHYLAAFDSWTNEVIAQMSSSGVSRPRVERPILRRDRTGHVLSLATSYIAPTSRAH